MCRSIFSLYLNLNVGHEQDFLRKYKQATKKFPCDNFEVARNSGTFFECFENKISHALKIKD